ncbi:MAG: HEAT repeat domain-containing protein [Planctomycetota bacterium]|jgi:HEAT repeat protein
MRLAGAVVATALVALATSGACAQDSPGGGIMGTTTGGGEIMTNDKVIALVESKLSEELTIRMIRASSRTQFDMTVEGVVALKKAGVSDQVLDVMWEIWEKQRKLHDRNIRIYIQFLRTDRLDEYDRALRELRAYGAYAVPLLMENLRDEDERIRAGCCEVLGRIAAPESLDSLFQAMVDRNQSVRWKAARAVSMFAAEKEAKEVAERLATEMARKGQHRDGFALALGYIRDLKYLGDVVELADDPAAGEDQAAASYALGLLGEPSAEVLKVLKENVLDYPMRELRESAARALSRLAPKMDRRTRADVALALAASARRYAASRDVLALQLRHFPTRSSVEALIEIVGDRDKDSSGAAWESLKAVTGELYPQDAEQWRSWWEIAQIQPRWREEPAETARREGRGSAPEALPEIPDFAPEPETPPAHEGDGTGDGE